MKVSDNAAQLLAALLDLEKACAAGTPNSVEQLALRSEQAAQRLTPADFAACDREALARLRRTARATAGFLRRVIRLRGMRLTMRRFGQVENAGRRGITG